MLLLLSICLLPAKTNNGEHKFLGGKTIAKVLYPTDCHSTQGRYLTTVSIKFPQMNAYFSPIAFLPPITPSPLFKYYGSQSLAIDISEAMATPSRVQICIRLQQERSDQSWDDQEREQLDASLVGRARRGSSNWGDGRGWLLSWLLGLGGLLWLLGLFWLLGLLGLLRCKSW